MKKEMLIDKPGQASAGETRYGDKSASVNKESGRMSGGMAEVMGHASPVYAVPTMSEQADMGRVRPARVGNRGYPQQAWEYQF
jgi:hypothetical protein